MQISPETMAEFLQLGGQYALPAAALLRALYSGIRGKMPEGFAQIAIASILAGLTAVIDPSQPFDWRVAFNDLLSNTVFMAGLLSFIVIYLLRQPDRGRIIDGIVGAVLGAAAWFFWTQMLGNDWPWWTVLLVVPAGAVIFIALRFSLRQIVRVVRIATYLIVLGVILLIGGGAVLLANWAVAQLN